MIMCAFFSVIAIAAVPPPRPPKSPGTQMGPLRSASREAAVQAQFAEAEQKAKAAVDAAAEAELQPRSAVRRTSSCFCR